MAKILIIDDDESFRLMLCKLLSKSGYTVIEAKDGDEGLRIQKIESPDLIVTDIVMPNQDGIGTIMALKKEAPEIKIIAVSGVGLNQPHDYLKMAKALGANQIFTKPIGHKEFLKGVKKVLNE